jgi:DNA-binding winged helix-turn-helix (wHTH) protein/Flp pilus assembly protein TadD
VSRERYRIADLLLDVDAVSLRREGHPKPSDIALPKLSFDLLVTLARRAPAVVTSDDLIALIWEGNAVSDETLTQRAALLRRALGDDARQPRYLRAVRGRGYQLVPEVVSLPAEAQATQAPGVEEVTAATAATAAEYEEREPPPARRRLRRAVAWSAALLGALAVASVPFLLARHPRSGSSEAATTPAAAREPANPIMTRAPSLPELLERAGVYLRQQQRGNNELALELYRRALALDPREPRALAGLSLALAQRATKFNERSAINDEALALARRAVEIAPRLSLAHHALGMALDAQGRITPALAAYRRAAEFSGREDSSASALASAAHLLQVQGHLAEALEANLRVARMKASRDDSPYLEVQIGSTLALLGFEAPATVWLERALELRPDNVFAASTLARMHLSRARLREADAIAASALARGVRRPELWEVRGTVALLRGDEPAARRAFRAALDVAPGYSRARTQLLLLDLREDLREGKAMAELEAQRRTLIAEARKGQAQGDEWPDSWIDQALLETGTPLTGAADGPARNLSALAALDGAIAHGFRDAGWLLLQPGFAGLRGDPRFQRRIEAIRLSIDAERQRVLGAPWLPQGFLEGDSRSEGSAASK